MVITAFQDRDNTKNMDMTGIKALPVIKTGDSLKVL